LNHAPFKAWQSAGGVRLTSLVGTAAAAGLSTAVTGAATPERCIEAYYLLRTRFESIAERKLRRRQLAEDGNLKIRTARLAVWVRGRTFRGGRIFVIYRPNAHLDE
jgi:hypothetical protein